MNRRQRSRLRHLAWMSYWIFSAVRMHISALSIISALYALSIFMIFIILTRWARLIQRSLVRSSSRARSTCGIVAIATLEI